MPLVASGRMTETTPTPQPAPTQPPILPWRHRARLAGALLVLCAAVMTLSWWVRGPSDTFARALAPTTAAAPGVDRLAESAVILLGVLAVVAGWRGLRSGAAGAALAVAAALGVGTAYLASEGLKAAVASDRVCRDLAGVDCPAVGDWGFPSNHTVIAAAGATAVLLLVRRWWPAWARWTVVALAVCAGAGRVLQGVHAPHEVVAGAALGATAVLVVTMLLAPGLAPVLARAAAAGRARQPGPGASPASQSGRSGSGRAPRGSSSDPVGGSTRADGSVQASVRREVSSRQPGR